MSPGVCCFASLPSFGFRSTRNGREGARPEDVEHRDVERRRLRREHARELRVRRIRRGRMRNDLHLDPGVLRELLRERDVTIVTPADGVADERDRLAAVLLLEGGGVRHLRRRVGRCASPRRCLADGANRPADARFSESATATSAAAVARRTMRSFISPVLSPSATSTPGTGGCDVGVANSSSRASPLSSSHRDPGPRHQSTTCCDAGQRRLRPASPQTYRCSRRQTRTSAHTQHAITATKAIASAPRGDRPSSAPTASTASAIAA